MPLLLPPRPERRGEGGTTSKISGSSGEGIKEAEAEASSDAAAAAAASISNRKRSLARGSCGRRSWSERCTARSSRASMAPGATSLKEAGPEHRWGGGRLASFGFVSLVHHLNYKIKALGTAPKNYGVFGPTLGQVQSPLGNVPIFEEASPGVIRTVGCGKMRGEGGLYFVSVISITPPSNEQVS
jgi:hypothetical protein